MSSDDREHSPEQAGTEKMSGDGIPPSPPSPRGVILLVYHPGGTESAQLNPGEPLSVGRSEPAALIVPYPKLSREHARFTLRDGKVLVEDLQSTNGVWMAGRRVERVELDLGGEVMLAEAVARVFALGQPLVPDFDGKETFRDQVEDELSRAQTFHRSFAVLAVRVDLPPGSPRGAWVTRLREGLRPVDRVHLYTPEVALVLLPETGADSALTVARGAAARLGEAGLPCGAGVAGYPGAASTADELIDKAREAAARAAPKREVILASTDAWAPSEVAAGDQLVAGAAMKEVLAVADRLVTSKIPVLLHGETGTGKEVLANYIHAKGPRRDRSIIRVNCGAIPASLLEGSLFGHERGAFTGATQQRTGFFEDADGGTLFLDEIGELSAEAQAALLRVLETGTFSRVGSTREIKVDVRVIAATHRDLKGMIEEGQFREDLYYRLSTMVLEIPPLRERMDEIEQHCQRFIALANERDGRRVRAISEEAMEVLRAYDWPGNVRQLRNAVDVAVLMAQGDVIQVGDLPSWLRDQGRGGEGGSGGGLDPVRQKEKEVIEAALRKAGWNRAKAAKLLGTSESTLGRRVREFGIKEPKKK